MWKSTFMQTTPPHTHRRKLPGFSYVLQVGIACMSNFTHTGVLSLPLVLSLQSSGQKRGVLRHSHMRLPVYPPAFRLANFRDCRTSETLLFHQCFLITEKREPTYVGEQKRARFISYPKMVPAFKISSTWVVLVLLKNKVKEEAQGY